MPWKMETMETNREEFVKRALAHEKSKLELCREYGFSRPTGDKWIKRYQETGDLKEQSRRPFLTANKIDPKTEELIIGARKREPAIGALKVRRMLINSGWASPPSASTINAVFKRNGLITREASEKAQPCVRFAKDEPNDMWQADFKGNFLLCDNTRCHPLSVVDDNSRYCLCVDAKLNEQAAGVKESLLRTFNTYGLPKTILCDNGTPWGSSQTTSITAIEVWLMEYGILTMHIRPKHPQTQGKVERFNGSYKQERLSFYVPRDINDAQKSREEYRCFYNNYRPHHALNLDCPAQHYRVSPRKLPEKISEWDYEPGAELRSIKSSGYISYDGQGYYLSEGIGKKTVAICPSEIDGVMNIVFREFQIARLDLRERTITSRRVYLLHDDPRQ